jgi:hypothetical protein
MHPTCTLWTNQYWLDYYINNIHTSKLVSNYHVKFLFSIEPKVKCFQILTFETNEECVHTYELFDFEISVISHAFDHQILIALHKVATCSSHLVTTRNTWFPHYWVLTTLVDMLQMFKFLLLELCIVSSIAHDHNNSSKVLLKGNNLDKKIELFFELPSSITHIWWHLNFWTHINTNDSYI